MRLLKHLTKRGYQKKTGTCDCQERYIKSYNQITSVIVWRWGEVNRNRKKGRRAGKGSEIELWINGDLQEQFRLHDTAREFDEWLKSKGFLGEHVKVTDHG